MGLVTLALLLVVVGTGIYLAWFYQPAGATGPGIPGSYHVAQVVRHVHRLGSWALVPASLVVLGLTLHDRRAAGRLRVAAAAVVAPAAVAAMVIGFLLPWDQLALWAVTVGHDYRGYRWLRGEEIRFVVLRSGRTDSTGVAWMLAAHVALAVAALVALALVVARRRARPPAVPDSSIVVVATPTVV